MMMTNIDFKNKTTEEQEKFKTQLHEMLIAGQVVVEFEKADGAMRVMTSTLNPQIIPPAPPPKVLAEGEIAKTKKPNPDVCAVWDVNATAWRSFRFDRVKSIKY